MSPPADRHPSPDELRAFGVGRLDSVASETLVQHLETCADCRQLVAESSGDTFLSRLRSAKPGSVLSADGTAAYVPRANEIPPELANNPEYEDLVELGRGGMGVVYKARNTLMGRLEVLKVMNKEMMSKPGAVDRFRREVQSAARLDHPNIVRAYSARMLGDLLVFTMEFVPGEELGKLVRARGRLPIMHACYYAQQVANGLQHAHENGMVHRDIKPANLILRVEGKKHTIKILDFGLAKLTSERGFDAGLTGEGRMLGTPDYIAPEQIVDAQSAGIQADIYSLGCTLYYLLAGHPPFQGNSLFELLKKHQEETAPPLALTRPDVPDELAGIVAKMMAKDPSRRFQTPAEVAKALAPFVKPGVARPKSNQPPAALPVIEPLPNAAKPAGNMWETMAIESIDAKSLVARPKKNNKAIPVWPAAALIVGLLAIAVIVGLWVAGALRAKTQDAPAVAAGGATTARLTSSPTPAATIRTTAPSSSTLPSTKTEPPRVVTTPAENPRPMMPKAEDPKVPELKEAAPAPPTAKLKVLFHDDFDDPASGFERNNDKGNLETYSDGKYLIKNLLRRQNRAHRGREESFGPCAYEVLARMKAGPSDYWAFQINNWQQKLGFAVRLHNDGTVAVWEGATDAVKEGLKGPLAGPFDHPAMKKDGEWNRLLLIFRAGSIELFVNDKAVGKPIAVDPTFDPNRLQFVLSTRAEGQVEFERITVYSLEGLQMPGQPRRPFAWPAADIRDGKIRAPDLSKAEVLWFDDFGDPGKSGWRTGTASNAYGYERKAWFLDRKYFVEVNAGYGTSGTGKAGPFADFALHVRGRVPVSPLQAWGVIITSTAVVKADGPKAENHTVEVSLDNEGRCQIRATAIGLTTGWFEHSAVKKGNESNEILLIFKGRRCEVYVNSVAVYNPVEFKDQLAEFRAALAAYSRGKGARAEFERFTIHSCKLIPALEER